MSEIEVSRPTLVTPPVMEPITLAEARKQCELSPSDSSHDDHLSMLIQTAREQWEHDTDSCCLTQTLSVTCERLSDDEIYLPKRPVQSITHVKYLDSNETLTTLPTTVYELDAACRAVRLKYLQVWPTTLQVWNSVTVTYVAGYTSTDLVPAIYKQAIRLLVGHYFENRDMMMSEALQSMKAYEALVSRFLRSTYP